MSKALFSKKDRNESTLKHSEESFYQFLDRSSAPQAIYARQILEECAEHFAKAHTQRATWLFEQCMNNNAGYFSAAFELLLHHHLHSDGFEIEIAPSCSHSDINPSFLVHSPAANQEFYLDCAHYSENLDDSVKSYILEALKKIKHQNFMVAVDFHGHSDGTLPSLEAFKQQTIEWLNSLNPIQVEENLVKNELVSFGHKFNNGFFIELSALPKSASDRQTESSILCIDCTADTKDWTPSKALRKAIRKKASPHHKSNKPYVVAVSPDSHAADLTAAHAVETLYGDSVNMGLDLNKPLHARKPNGLWSNQEENNGVAGVWLFYNPLDAFGTVNCNSDFFINTHSAHEVALAQAMGEFDYIQKPLKRSKKHKPKKLAQKYRF